LESKALSDIKCGPKYASNYVKLLTDFYSKGGEFPGQGSE